MVLSRRLRSLPVAAALVAGITFLTVYLLLGGNGDAPVTYTSAAVVEMAVPSGETRRASVPADDDAPTNPDLLEPSPFGPLPRAAVSGDRPIFAYARPFDLEDSRPKVAIVLLGLGLQQDVTEAALQLPGGVSLQFSPYAPTLDMDVAAARRRGHEVLLGLPMEPPDFPENDPGPHTLLADAGVEENRDRLLWVLSRTTGYVGVVGEGRVFAESAAAKPVMRDLAERGLALVEVGHGGLTEGATEAGLPYARAAAPLDADPSPLAIDYALARLEEEALERGSAIGVALAYPVSIDRLSRWIDGLERKGLVLAPVSALLIEGAGLAARLRGEGVAGEPDLG